ncbi:MAG: hypothetical protein IT336_14085 [Thermomicrobiales bacterium]|nr:hypothetical protein [Thermomicrobiales bacterium]
MQPTELPPEYPDDRLEARVRDAVAASSRKLIALDDDPTGVQTVHDTAVLARWDPDLLANELRNPAPCFFLLTNSRALPESDAAALNREIVRNLRAASADTVVEFAIASRSDSTLRGHFPAETDAIVDELGGVDGVLICPAFFEGGRITVDDVHYLKDGDRYVPVGETEFARDATFGYRSSNLRDWVAEKTGGRISAAEVASLPLVEIRAGGPDRVAELLAGVAHGQPVIVNAASYQDLWVVALGLLRAEAAGIRFVYRTGASFVRARAGIPARPLLTRAELLGPLVPPYSAGLVVVGSHVRRSSEQLARLLDLPGLAPIEIDVRDLLANERSRTDQIRDAIAAAEAALQHGLTPVFYTSRDLHLQSDQLAVSRAVSEGLVEIVAGIERQPGWIVAQGGITSSDVGTEALGVRRAVVLGQIRPGIPVWRLGDETRDPGLAYVVFPGNVGGPETLAEIVRQLRGDR